MGRGKTLSRIMRLRARLERCQEISVQALANEYGVSVRTLYRDLPLLEDEGVPIFQERRGRRVYWRVVEHSRRAVVFDFQEVLALSMAWHAFGGMVGVPLQKALASALDKVQRTLPAPLQGRAQALGGRMTASLGATHTYPAGEDAYGRLIHAVEHCRTVRLDYAGLGARHRMARLVDPYCVFTHGSSVYVYGFCHVRNDVRTFHLARLHRVEDAGTTFQRPHASVTTPAIHGMFGPWDGRSVHVVLRFNARAAARVTEQRVHPSQRVQVMQRGGAELAFDMPVCPALVQWVAAFGGDVKVARPARLAEAVRELHRAGNANDPRDPDV